MINSVQDILAAFRDGELDLQAAAERLRSGLFCDLGHSRVDVDRPERNGTAEVVFGAGKTPGQLLDIAQTLRDRGQDVLITRLDAAKVPPLLERWPGAVYHELPRLLCIQPKPPRQTATTIAVVCAGTSDLAVAEEARITAEFLGNRVETVYDVGVAGLHRLVADLPRIRAARVVITVAGMEGALPSVVGGLVKAPVIAVPTSVGYGASLGGIAALLTMLNSCASGLSVVNIDNGFGAAYQASLINHL